MNTNIVLRSKMAGEDDGDDRKRKALDDVPSSVREGIRDGAEGFFKQAG